MSRIDNNITELAPAPAPAPIRAAPIQAPSVARIHDDNKMYAGYNPGRDNTFMEPQQQPPAMQQPSARVNNPPAPVLTAPIQEPSVPEIPDYKIDNTFMGPQQQPPAMQRPSARVNNPPAPVNTAPIQAPSVAGIHDDNKMYSGYSSGSDKTLMEPQQQPPAMQRPFARVNNPPAPIHTAPIQEPSVLEIPDYNRMYTGYDPGRDYQEVPPAIQPSATANNRRSSIQFSPDTTFITSSNTAGYGPLDYDYGMTSSPPGTAVQGGMVGGNPGRRRSIAEFLSDVIVGGDIIGDDSDLASSTSPATTFSDHTHQRSTSNPPAPTAPKENLGRRRSSLFSFMGFKGEADGNEHKGPHSNVSRSQIQHMEQVPEAEQNLRITHNADELPEPHPEPQTDVMPEDNQHRRSSVARFLGLGKPLLAR
ncbi:hypothetical protein BGZ52_005183 [Haplosporangium bisporale]|nr:hypothetical protein BGZ52_005183 [Haplosporangium bisporale]